MLMTFFTRPFARKPLVALLSAMCLSNVAALNMSCQIAFCQSPFVQANTWQERSRLYQQKYDAENWPGKEAAAREALNQKISKGVQGKELADAYQALGDTIFNQYHFPKALPNYQAALAIREKLSPSDSVDVANSLYGVGFCTKDRDPHGALELLQRSQAIMEKKYGTDSMEVYKPLAPMLIIYFSLHQASEARKIQERLSSIISKQKGMPVEVNYAEAMQTAIFRGYDGDKIGAKEAIEEAKKIRAAAPPGYFPPDSLDNHLSWADNRLFKPQNLRPTKTSNSNPQAPGSRPTIVVAPAPTPTTPAPAAPSDEPKKDSEVAPATPIATVPPRSKTKSKRPAGDYTYYINGKKVSYDFYQARVLYNEAGKLISDKQYTLARAKLEESQSLDPHFAEGLCALGTVLAHLGMKDDAIQKLQEAINITPQLDSAWVALAGIFEEVGKLGEALDAYRQFLRRFPNDPSHDMILSTTRLAELEFRSRTKESKCPKITGADGIHDYTVSAAREGLERWAQSEFPIKIYIKPMPNRVGNVDCPALCRRSLKEWTDRTSGLISFKEVPSPADAKIVVGWVTAAGELNEDAEAGEANVQTSDGVVDSAKVSIDVRKPDADQFEGKLHTTILHEVGHCLGLIGHSPSATDVMYFTELMTGPIAGLSDRDVKTIQLIYGYPVATK